MTQDAPPIECEPAIVRVGDGRGFLARADHSVLVVTAAHCLPHLPPPHPASYTEERTYASLIGALGEEPSIWTECVFVDPIADVAVLAEPDGQALFDEWQEYVTFTDERSCLRVGPIQRMSHVWLFGRDGQWHRGSATQSGGYAGFATCLSVEAPDAAIAPGTSGSPIISPDGRVVALVSCGARLNPILHTCVPDRVGGQLATGVWASS